MSTTWIYSQDFAGLLPERFYVNLTSEVGVVQCYSMLGSMSSATKGEQSPPRNPLRRDYCYFFFHEVVTVGERHTYAAHACVHV